MLSGLGQDRSEIRATKRFGKDRLTSETTMKVVEPHLADKTTLGRGRGGMEHIEVAVWSKLAPATSPRER